MPWRRALVFALLVASAWTAGYSFCPGMAQARTVAVSGIPSAAVGCAPVQDMAPTVVPGQATDQLIPECCLVQSVPDRGASVLPDGFQVPPVALIRDQVTAPTPPLEIPRRPAFSPGDPILICLRSVVKRE